MKTFLVAALAFAAVASLALADSPATPTSPSWGDLTKEVAGLELGQHASGEETPRQGLANIVEQGNLGATIDLLEGEDLPE